MRRSRTRRNLRPMAPPNLARRLAGGSAGLALLCDAVATGAALVALILTFGPVSGAHSNPAVTLADASMPSVAPEVVVPHPRGDDSFEDHP